MVSQRRLFNLLTMLIMLSLLAVACERPLGGTDDGTADDQTVQTEDASAGAGTDGSGEVTTAGDTTDAATTDPVTSEDSENTPADTAAEDSASESDDTTGDATATQDDSSEVGGGVGDVTTDSGDTAQASGEGEDTAVQDTTATEESNESVTTPETHTVAAGENLYRIGLKYGISWISLANINGLANPNILSVGQVLKLTGGSTSDPGPTPSPQTETTYIVRSGDNLFRIGLKFGISWVQIAEANGLVNPNLISVGSELKIPVNTPGPAPQFSHVVKQGETLFLISLQYGVTWPAIAEANNLTSPYIIYVGQTLVIPGSQ